MNRLANALPGAGGIENSPAPENEGVYLQGAIPHTAQSGKPMHFATDSDHHLTEDSGFNTLETRTRLDHDWDPWFEPGLAWRVEKSPVNMCRMRLLQQLFPMSQFIVVLRHPEAVAASVSSWVDTPLPDLHNHWIAAHEQLSRDLPFLHAVMVLRYEDIVAAPERTTAQIAAFLDLPPAPPPETIANGNARYEGTQPLSPNAAQRVQHWGYARNLGVDPWSMPLQHPLRATRDAIRAMEQHPAK